MSMFNDYATKSDLAEYMGKEEHDLPEGIDILLRRASEVVGIAMRNNYLPRFQSHVEAAKLATCAQCQFWLENNINPVSSGNISSYSLGELSITYSDVDKLSDRLCSTSARYLNSQCLMYKGL